MNRAKQIGMRLDAIVRALRFGPAILPRAVGQIQMPHRLESFAGFVRDAFILGVPDDHARMVPALAHPFGILRNDLFADGLLRRVTEQPDGKFILNQEALFVGDVVPNLRRKTDAISNRIPMHTFEFPVQPSHPFGPPGFVAPPGVLEEAIDTHIRAPHKIRLAVQNGPPGFAVESKRAHPESRSRVIARRPKLQFVKKRILRGPQMTIRNRNRKVNRHLLLIVRSGQSHRAATDCSAGANLPQSKTDLQSR